MEKNILTNQDILSIKSQILQDIEEYKDNLITFLLLHSNDNDVLDFMKSFEKNFVFFLPEKIDDCAKRELEVAKNHFERSCEIIDSACTRIHYNASHQREEDIQYLAKKDKLQNDISQNFDTLATATSSGIFSTDEIIKRV